jgi:hypothetical protein
VDSGEKGGRGFSKVFRAKSMSCSKEGKEEGEERTRVDEGGLDWACFIFCHKGLLQGQDKILVIPAS